MNKKTEMHRQINISSAESFAIVCALDFISHCEKYSFANKPFNWETIAHATEKLEEGISTYSKSELAACVAAVDLALISVQSRDANFDQVADIFPELIPDLEDSANLLQALKPRLIDYIKDLT